MPQLRRTADRRRRVLYHSHVSPPTPSTPATRRATEELRAARQPAQAFGSRVHQHLRGRWFSLVPVSRLAMSLTATVVLVISIALAILHHLTITWPSLAYHEQLARPLQIYRSDSFAAWWLTMLLLLSAGATQLIYVLRRHRRDDYRGHYQLWRLTLVVLVLVSIHSTADLVGWLGAWLDLLVGDRAVLSGANWLRIVLDVGGIILAMRLVAEVYRCRPALIAMLASAALIGLSEAAIWNVFVVDGVFKASLVIAAPMLGWSCFLVAATLYLRSMYRQIRNIPDAPSIRTWLAQWMAQRRNREEDDYDSEFFETQTAPRPAVAVTSVETRRPVAEPRVAEPRVAKRNADAGSDDETDPSESPQPNKPGWFARFRRRREDLETQAKSDKPTSDASPESDQSIGTKPKRRWFGLRAAKPIVDEDDSESAADPESDSPTQKKRWFSLRLKPQQVHSEPDQAEDLPQPSDEDNQHEPKAKSGWLGGLLRRKNVSSDEENTETESTTDRSSDSPSRNPGPLSARSQGPLSSAARQKQAAPADIDDDDIDPDDLDWDSMSKAERRRVRKKIKRSGRAA